MKPIRLFCFVLVLIFIAVGCGNKRLAYAEQSVAQLTCEERIFGLAKVWSGVKYNFANFDLVPDLDWDKAFQEYLPKASEEQSNVEYYRLIERFVALLHDNHTRVNLPEYVREMVDAPLISVENIEGKAVIVKVAETNEVKEASILPGMEITKVDGRSVDEILKDIYPFVAQSTPQGRDSAAYSRILRGAKGSRATVQIRDLKGCVRTVTLTRDSHRPEAQSFHSRPPLIELRRFSNGIVYFAVNSFGSEDVVSEFDKIFDSLENVEGMIIDVRENGGGNSTYGEAIIGRLTKKPLKANSGQTHTYIPAWTAQGNMRLSLKGEGRLIQPRAGEHFLGPLVVLVSVRTASAAEDFVSALHGNKRVIVVGGKTCGSTGNPFHVQLPGGGSVRICIGKSFYPDGRPFVGVGIIPDVQVYPTQKDIADGHDVQLEKGLEVLKGKMTEVSRSEVVFKTAYPFISEGNYYRRHGQLSDAICSYEEALEFEPDEIMVRLKLADIYRQQGREEDALKYYNSTGFLDDDAWMIIGPFDNSDKAGFDESYPPEQEIDFTKDYTGKRGTVKWFKPEYKQIDGFVNLAALLGRVNWAVAYAATSVQSPETREVQLRVGSDDGIKVWLNGELVLSRNIDRPAVPDQDIVHVTLHKGQNQLLLKVYNRLYSWGFYMRITDITGKPFNDIGFSSRESGIKRKLP
jgi:carboxyl-terminal processing protease